MSEDAKPAEPKKATLKAAKPKIDIVKDDKDAVLARLYRGIPLRVKDMTPDRKGDHEYAVVDPYNGALKSPRGSEEDAYKAFAALAKHEEQALRE